MLRVTQIMNLLKLLDEMQEFLLGLDEPRSRGRSGNILRSGFVIAFSLDKLI
jgi:hypothetical protein